MTSDFEDMVEQTTGSRGIRRRSSRFLVPEQVPRFHCDFCKRDISRKIRIKCAECTDFDLCVECFAVGVEHQEHKKTHSYRVIDDLSFAVFSSSWGADEELLFFEGVCDFGISNWEAVAQFVGSKSAEACKQHYVELIEKEDWMEDLPDVSGPVTTDDVKETAFPMEIDSDEFDSMPRSLSPCSSIDAELSSESEEEEDEAEGEEWIMVRGTSEMAKLPGDDTLPTPSDVDIETDPVQTEVKFASSTLTPAPQTPSDHKSFSEFDDVKQDEKKEEEQEIQEDRSQGTKRKKVSEKKPEAKAKRLAPADTQQGSKPRRSLSSLNNNAGDVTGYNQFRQEFDPPYDPGAEQMIADLEFLDDDPEEVTKAKIKLLHLYRWRIQERERRTTMLKKNKYGLMDVRKIIAMERAWSHNEKFSELRPFARYASLEKIDRLAKGSCFEKTLRKRIQELQEARAAECRTFADIRARSKDIKGLRGMERVSVQMIGKCRRQLETAEDGITMPIVPELNDQEKAFCAEVGFSSWQFAVLRDRLLREAEEHGNRFSKSLVRSFFRLDTTQAVKLFDFFLSEGRLINADKDRETSKKINATNEPIDKLQQESG